MKKLCLVLAVFLAACGGGGSDSTVEVPERQLLDGERCGVRTVEGRCPLEAIATLPRAIYKGPGITGSGPCN